MCQEMEAQEWQTKDKFKKLNGRRFSTKLFSHLTLKCFTTFSYFH